MSLILCPTLKTQNLYISISSLYGEDEQNSLEGIVYEGWWILYLNLCWKMLSYNIWYGQTWEPKMHPVVLCISMKINFVLIFSSNLNTLLQNSLTCGQLSLWNADGPMLGDKNSEKNPRPSARNKVFRRTPQALQKAFPEKNKFIFDISFWPLSTPCPFISHPCPVV